jgi:FkbM family methyltransferase
MIPRFVKSLASAVLPESAYRAIQIWRNVPERPIFSGYVKRGDTVVDIGANIGWHTYLLARKVGPSGTVHSFEPIPATCTRLERLVEAEGFTNVVVHRYGCGDKDEFREFVVPTDAAFAHIKSSSEDCEGSQTVRIVRLDDVIQHPVSFIKCDVEGAELFVLRGAERILSEFRPVVLCEIEERWTGRFGIKPHEVFAFMKSLGYTCRPSFDWVPGTRWADNYLFLHY